MKKILEVIIVTLMPMIIIACDTTNAIEDDGPYPISKVEIDTLYFPCHEILYGFAKYQCLYTVRRQEQSK